MNFLRVHGNDRVEEQVTDGASLGWHAHLDVRGDFRGAAHLSPGSVLTVHGVYEGTRVGREGTLVVMGRCALSVAWEQGTAVGAGVVLVDTLGWEWSVGDDGSVVPREPLRLPVQVCAGVPPRVLRWSVRLDRFVTPS